MRHIVRSHLLYVQLLDNRQILEVLVGDCRDWDVDDLDLVLSNEVQEKVHRASKNVEIDTEIHRCVQFLRGLGSLSAMVTRSVSEDADYNPSV